MGSMKKLLILFLILFIQFFYTNCKAKTIKVVALENFDSLNPPKNFSVNLDETFKLSEEKSLYKYYTLKGYIYEVIPPKRLKQNASFIFIPTSYTDYSNKTHELTNVVSKYTTKFAIKDFSINSALLLTIGAVPTIAATTGYFAVEGAIKNEKGNRLKSSTTNAYEKSYLSLGKKGKPLKIKKNQPFLLDIIVIKEHAPNYEIKQTKP